MNAVNRRKFLAQCAEAALSAWALPTFAEAEAISAPSFQFPSRPRDRVAVAAYPFREFIVEWKESDGKSSSAVPASKKIPFQDFAAHVVEKFNVHKIELWNHTFPSTDPRYLEEFRAAVEKVNSAVVDIAVDEDHSQYSPVAAVREKAVKSSKRWVNVAAALGSPSIRTHVQGEKDVKPDVSRAADTLARVAAYGATKSVVIHLENDDAVSEDPFFIAQILDKVKNPWLRALPDFGNTLNTHDDDYNFRALDAMFAHAYGICHVKAGEINPEGKPTHVDLARTFAILKKNGYKGYCSIEYDAPGDPYKPTAELVEKSIQFLS